MTPAEIAARAAAVAAEWTPERYTAWRLDLCDALDRRKYTSAALVAQKAADAIGALLADRERLRGLVAGRTTSSPTRERGMRLRDRLGSTGTRPRPQCWR